MLRISNSPVGFPCFAPDRMGAWLQQEVDWGDETRLQGARLNRLWVGQHGRLSFELALDLIRDGVFYTAELQGGQGPFNGRRRMRGRISRHGLKGLRLFNSELGVWCCTPDRDWKLPSLGALLGDGRAASVLAETAAAPILGIEDGGGRIRCDIAAYRAGKRCTVRARSSRVRPKRDVFIKVFRRGPSVEYVETLQRLSSYLQGRSSGAVRMPELIDACCVRNLLITAGASAGSCGAAAQPGKLRPLGTGADDLSAAAAALAMLHDAPVGAASRIHTPQDELQTASRWVPALQALGETRWARLRELLVELSRCLTIPDDPGTILIHRDFFAAQLVRCGETVWLFDFDTLCAGDGEVDLSTFVAHLFLDELTAGASTTEVQQTGAKFIEEYVRSGGRVSKSGLRFYLPCALVRLGAIHLARGVPANVVEGLWNLAAGHLAASWQLV